MTAYYNENDPYAAQWLRNLIAEGLIAPGEVDDRSIKEVRPDDLAGYTQCHFFAGIGGWSYALKLAGWPDDRFVWTGSCPCQPFSEAGKQKGLGDERHLWPTWGNLIRQCEPPDVFGEQVASAAFWFDGVFADLEEMGYAVAASVLPACAVDAPHIRERLWFVANSERGGRRKPTAHPAQEGQSLRSAVREEGALGSGSGGEAMAQPNGEGWQVQRCGLSAGRAFIARGALSANRQWEPEPPVGRVAHGIPAKSHKLRAYGNAIVPQAAAQFIGAYLDHASAIHREEPRHLSPAAMRGIS